MKFHTSRTFAISTIIYTLLHASIACAQDKNAMQVFWPSLLSYRFQGGRIKATSLPGAVDLIIHQLRLQVQIGAIPVKLDPYDVKHGAVVSIQLKGLTFGQALSYAAVQVGSMVKFSEQNGIEFVSFRARGIIEDEHQSVVLLMTSTLKDLLGLQEDDTDAEIADKLGRAILSNGFRIKEVNRTKQLLTIESDSFFIELLKSEILAAEIRAFYKSVLQP